MKVKDAMTAPAISVRPDTRCKDAAALLVQHRISALPVTDEAGRLVGIVSENDLLALETTPDPRSQATPLRPRELPIPTRVEEVMTTAVHTVEEDTDLAIAAQRMLDAGVKRLPVTRGPQLVGIVSRHDLVRVLARTDEDVEAAVRRTLADEGMRLANLRVEVRDGVVRLSGGNGTTALRMAEILSRTVPGVLDVRVSGPSGEEEVET